MSQAHDIVIRELRADDVPAAIEVLADAFIDFPVLQVMTGTGAGAHERLARLFAMEFEPEAKMSAIVAELDGCVVGVLTYTDSPACSAMSAGRMLRFVRIAGPRIFRAVRMFGRIERMHPKSSHRHLPSVGVAPALQARGIGRRLMEEFDRRCDEDGIEAFLETIRWKEGNHPSHKQFYRRLGYVVSEELPMTGEWSVLAMTRAAGGEVAG